MGGGDLAVSYAQKSLLYVILSPSAAAAENFAGGKRKQFHLCVLLFLNLFIEHR